MPLLQVLQIRAGVKRKQEIVEEIIATLADGIEAYNEAVRINKVRLMERYWRDLCHAACGGGANFVLISATGKQAIPQPHTSRTSVTTAPSPPPTFTAATLSLLSNGPSATANAPRNVTTQHLSVPATNSTAAMWMQSAESQGLKRKRADDESGLPNAKRPNLGTPSGGLAASSSGSYIPPAPSGLQRPGFLPFTNVCLGAVNDPFYNLAPYPELVSFQLDSHLSTDAAVYAPTHPSMFDQDSSDLRSQPRRARSRAFQLNINNQIWQQMEGKFGLKAILRCFPITPVPSGSPPPEPAQHSWPLGAYISINQQYVELEKFKKDARKMTQEMPLDMNPWLNPGCNNVTIQATGMLKYQVVVQLMRPNSVTDLVERTRTLSTIPTEAGKQHVIKSLRSNVVEKKNVTLLDPVLLTRIRIPARPSHCLHIECFDLAHFLRLNERSRTWRCPVCGSEAPYEKLIVDGWMNSILTTLGPEESEIMVYTDVTWADERGHRPVGQILLSKPAPAQNFGRISTRAPQPATEEDFDGEKAIMDNDVPAVTDSQVNSISENSIPVARGATKRALTKTNRLQFLHVLKGSASILVSLLKLDAKGGPVRAAETVSYVRLIDVSADSIGKEYHCPKFASSLTSLGVVVPQTLNPGTYTVAASVGGCVVETDAFAISADDLKTNSRNPKPTAEQRATSEAPVKQRAPNAEPNPPSPTISQPKPKPKRASIAAEAPQKTAIMSTTSTHKHVSTWVSMEHNDAALKRLFDLLCPYLVGDATPPTRLGPFESQVLGSFRLCPFDDLSAEEQNKMWKKSVQELNIRMKSKRSLRVSIDPTRGFSVVLVAVKAIVAAMWGSAIDIACGRGSSKAYFLGGTRSMQFFMRVLLTRYFQPLMETNKSR
jgi:hypothetical protein